MKNIEQIRKAIRLVESITNKRVLLEDANSTEQLGNTAKIKELTDSFTSLGYTLSKFEFDEQKGYWLVKLDKPTPKAIRSDSKNIFYYRFDTFEKSLNYTENYLGKLNSDLATKEAIKANRKEIQKDFKTSWKVGDILYSSSGYNQTRCQFYQIVNLKNRTVYLQHIGKKPVGYAVNNNEFDSWKVAPNKDKLIGEVFRKLISTYDGKPGRERVKINSYESASLYTKGEDGVEEGGHH